MLLTSSLSQLLVLFLLLCFLAFPQILSTFLLSIFFSCFPPSFYFPTSSVPLQSYLLHLLFSSFPAFFFLSCFFFSDSPMFLLFSLMLFIFSSYSCFLPFMMLILFFPPMFSSSTSYHNFLLPPFLLFSFSSTPLVLYSFSSSSSFLFFSISYYFSHLFSSSFPTFLLFFPFS